MSETQLYSERDLILAKRRAFRQGALHNDKCKSVDEASAHNAAIEREAAECYPLPKKVVPRVVTATEQEGTRCSFRIVDGRFQYRKEYWDVTRWDSLNAIISMDEAKAIADLLASPTVEVDTGD